jgi:hypothetical protein
MRAGKVKNVHWEQQLWTAYDDEPYFCARALIFLRECLTFQLAEPKKQHTKNISSIFMYMSVTIPGTTGITLFSLLENLTFEIE